MTSLTVAAIVCRAGAFSNVKLSRAMAISAAALADDLGAEGNSTTSKFRATTVTTGISLGFWFDNLGHCWRMCKIAEGYLVWFLVSGCLLLYPFTERGHWLSVIMASLYVAGANGLCCP